MADIAKIGFSVETSQLEKGVATLNKFSTTAKSANANAVSIGNAMSESAKIFAGAVAGMSRSVQSLVTATKGSTAEQITAAKETSEFANQVYRAAQAQEKLTVSANKAKKAVQGVQQGFFRASKDAMFYRNAINNAVGIGRTSYSAEESFMNMRSMMSGDAFREAVGMPPRDAMPNRFNTANIAAQFQDIGVTASMGMSPMLVAMQQGTQLSAILNSMESPLKGLAEAFKQIINPVSLASIALTALVVAGLQAVDWANTGRNALMGLSKAFDFVAEHAEVLTASVVGLSLGFTLLKREVISSTLLKYFKKLQEVATFEKMKAGVKAVGNLIATAFSNPITLSIAAIAGLTYAFVEFEDEINGFFGFDFTGLIKNAVNSMIGMFVGGLKNVYSLFKWLWDKVNELFGGKTVDKGLMDTLTGNMEKSMKTDYLGKSVEVVKRVAEAGSAKMKELANSIGDTTDELKKAADAWEKLIQKSDKEIASLKLERSLIGADTYTSTFWQTRFDMMNEAKEGGVTLTDDKINEIERRAKATAYLTNENEKLTESYEFAKDTTNGFFHDMRHSLWDGINAWEAFGDAVTNVLNKVLDKALDFGVDMVFQSFAGMGMFSGGGWNPGTTPPPVKPTLPAAKGHAFSNSVVDSPTLFKFAKGGRFGLMGEAGPEAVMPLRRGPDGSLGVKADGIANDNKVVVNVINNSDSQASVNQRETAQGIEIDVMIDKMVADKLSQPGTATHSSALAVNNRQLVAR